MRFSAEVPLPTDPLQPAPPLRWRLKVAWAALQGRSVMSRVFLARGDLDGTLHISVGHGFCMPNNSFRFEEVYVNGVPLREVDLTTVTVKEGLP